MLSGIFQYELDRKYIIIIFISYKKRKPPPPKKKTRPESWSKNKTICHLMLPHLTSHIIITMNFNSENLFFPLTSKLFHVIQPL